MPPKVRPRPRQPARSKQGATPGNDTVEALSTPSPKEVLATDNDDAQDTAMETEPTEVSQTQIPPTATPTASMSNPTAGAGSPPPRRSVQRLASVLPRSTPMPRSGSTLGELSAESRTGGGLKFKPKSFMRRSKEEREADERAEAERRAARQAAEGASSTRNRGGYHARGRGRGSDHRGGFGNNTRFNISQPASGHLGGSTIQDASTGKARRGGGSRAGPSGPSERTSYTGTTGVKGESAVKPEVDREGDVIMGSSTSKPKRTKVKQENQAPTYISSDGELDSDGGKRVNIEDINTINLVSSDDDEDDKDVPKQLRGSKGKERKVVTWAPVDALKPIRIQRREHVERAVGVNTDASSLTSAELRRRAKERSEAGGSLFLPEGDEAEILTASKPKTRRKPKDVEFVRDERKWKGVYQEEDDKDSIVKIKDEPKDDDDAMVVDEPVQDEESELLPIDQLDLTKAYVQNAVPDADDTVKPLATQEQLEEGKAEEEVVPQTQEKRRKHRGYHGARQVDIADEGEDEWEPMAEMTSIISHPSDSDTEPSGSKHASSAKARDDDGDIDMDDEVRHTHFQTKGAGEVFVFQLPPIVPGLRDLSKPTTTIKSEDKKKARSEAPPPANPTKPFAIHDANQIKSDPDAHPPSDGGALPRAYSADALTPTDGHAGTLSVHAKGALLATWGGMSLEVCGEGGMVQPAQELVMTEFATSTTKVEDEAGWAENVGVGDRGWAMGQTQKGLVCVPEWSALLG